MNDDEDGACELVMEEEDEYYKESGKESSNSELGWLLRFLSFFLEMYIIGVCFPSNKLSLAVLPWSTTHLMSMSKVNVLTMFSPICWKI